MSTNIRKLIKAGSAALAVLALSGLAVQTADAASARRQPNGAVRFYDDNGYDRGYAWCLQGGGSSFGAPTCDYYTLAQCQAAGDPQGQCTMNPWRYYTTVPPDTFRQ